MAKFHISQARLADRDEEISTGGHVPVAEADVKDDEFSEMLTEYGEEDARISRTPTASPGHRLLIESGRANPASKKGRGESVRSP